MFSPAGLRLWQEETACGAAQDEGLENRELQETEREEHKRGKKKKRMRDLSRVLL